MGSDSTKARSSSVGADAARRALPFDDPTIDALEPQARVEIGEMWQRRAASELRVGAQFSLLASGFASASASQEVQAMLSRAVADEARHSEICRAVAERYLGVAGKPEANAPLELARFGNSDQRTSLILHLVLLSCVNEGASTFYLRHAMQHSRSALARAALRELLSDDVEHARIGWAHLASPAVTTQDRVHVSRALPTLLGLSREAWASAGERGEVWFVDHGCPGRSVAEHAFERAVRDIVLPGMAHVGVDAGPATIWVEEQIES